MDSDRRIGIAITLLGIFAVISAGTTLITTTGIASYVISVGGAIAGLSMSGVGAGILLGKVETIEGADHGCATEHSL